MRILLKNLIRSYKKSFLILINDYDYQLEENFIKGKKYSDENYCKISYTNLKAELIIEIYFACFIYNNKKYGRYITTYFTKVKDLLRYEPDYKNDENCFEFEELKLLFPQLKEVREIEKTLMSFSRILIGEYWPTNKYLSELKTNNFGYKIKAGYNPPPFLSDVKAILKLLKGIKFIYDESELPVYEQSKMFPELRFKFSNSANLYHLSFEAKELEFYVTKNDTTHWFSGISGSQKDYENLKLMISISENI